MIENNYDAYNRANISLKIDGIDFTVNPSSVNFTLYDSIFNFYSKASLRCVDGTGNYEEYLAFINGTKVEFGFANNLETMIYTPYRVVKNSVPEQLTSQNPSGNLDISLIHDYFYYQDKKSKGYNNNISDIVKSLVSKYTFNKINIDNTLNSGIWYQPYMTDAEFIVKNLLPFAYSTDSDDTPYFCWIDSLNNFNFKSYNQLIQQQPVKELVYKSVGQFDTFEDNTIFKVFFAQTSLSDIRQCYNRIIGSYDENGNYVKNPRNSLISNYPKGSTLPIPIRADLNLVTSVFNNFDEDILLDENKNTKLGYNINNIRNTLFIDKIIIVVNFDRKLVAGKKIKISMPTTKSNDSSELSLRNSGEYIIESSYHRWVGNQALTMLVCSKQTVKLSADYYNFKNIIKRV